ncbi:MinD/ParA family protein [Eubacteriales bacterium OttesenSCG-928-N14]|nr:MinD/ParA family protein [Eubacteriales bacterium OttesenSCG-928-N14]
MMDQAQSLRNIMAAYAQQPSNTRVITITSGKGGVGKSSLAVNLALALQRRGKRVLIIDMDFGLANIDVMLGVKTQHDLYDVIQEKVDIVDAIESGLEGVRFISGGSGVYDLVKLNALQLHKIVNSLMRLDDLADIILFDTGAGISDNILSLIRSSHETILVTTPEPTAIMDAYAMTKIIHQQNFETPPKIRLVLNRAESDREAQAAMTGFINIAKKYTGFELEQMGYILRDDRMVNAVKMQSPLLVSYPRCIAAQNIDQLASRLVDEPIVQHQRLGIATFLNRLLGKN